MNTFMNVYSFLFTNIHELGLFITVHDHFTGTHLRFGMEVIRNHLAIMETAKFILWAAPCDLEKLVEIIYLQL